MEKRVEEETLENKRCDRHCAWLCAFSLKFGLANYIQRTCIYGVHLDNLDLDEMGILESMYFPMSQTFVDFIYIWRHE